MKISIKVKKLIHKIPNALRFFFITSINCPSGCPIICTDIYSQCYFVHCHLEQCLIHSSLDAILSIIASNGKQEYKEGTTAMWEIFWFESDPWTCPNLLNIKHVQLTNGLFAPYWNDFLWILLLPRLTTKFFRSKASTSLIQRNWKGNQNIDIQFYFFFKQNHSLLFKKIHIWFYKHDWRVFNGNIEVNDVRLIPGFS